MNNNTPVPSLCVTIVHMNRSLPSFYIPNLEQTHMIYSFIQQSHYAQTALSTPSTKSEYMNKPIYLLTIAIANVYVWITLSIHSV